MPILTMVTPATAGPMKRDTLKIRELMAMAGVRSSRGTRDGTTARRAEA